MNVNRSIDRVSIVRVIDDRGMAVQRQRMETTSQICGEADLKRVTEGVIQESHAGTMQRSGSTNHQRSNESCMKPSPRRLKTGQKTTTTGVLMLK